MPVALLLSATVSQHMTFTVWPLDGMEGTKPLQSF